MKGGSPLRTASAFAAPVVSARIAATWGECLWTARDLAEATFQAELAASAVGFLLGLPL